MKRSLTTLFCAAIALTPAFAQEKKTPADGFAAADEAAIVEVKNLSEREFNRLASTLRVMGIGVDGDYGMRMMFLRGPASRIKVAEAAIQKADQAQNSRARTSRSIEVTTYLLVAKNADGDGGALPADLEPVAKQLRTSFGLRQITLLETVLTRVREGRRAQSSGSFLWPGETDPTSYTLNFGETTLLALANRFSISSEEVFLDLRSARFGLSRVLNTALEMRDGQKIVLGKSSVGRGDALVAVITARVVE